MAIKTRGEELNKAIVDKVNSILANTNCPTEVKIEIEAKVGVAPHIKYQIEEFIVVEDSEGTD
jgi:hypothetical protein